jgi:lipopolysaccharide transport system permease protein
MNSRESEISRSKDEWDLVLKPESSFLSVPLREIWNYRDLMMMFVKRDVVTLYKQTILGPIWFFIQPILTVVIYLVVFSGIAGISTDGIPPALFYSAGVVTWNYFSETFTVTSRTFTENANLFGKVYFPRIIVPVSKIVSGLLKFFIQFGFFLAVLIFYLATGRYDVYPNAYALLLPMLVLLMAGLGLGFGVIFTSLTTKYRDLTFLITFGVQLLMYATPVIYPLSEVPEVYRSFLLVNPVTHIVEAFRFSFLGGGAWSWTGLGYTTIFNKVEKTFMDTV